MIQEITNTDNNDEVEITIEQKQEKKSLKNNPNTFYQSMDNDTNEARAALNQTSSLVQMLTRSVSNYTGETEEEIKNKSKSCATATCLAIFGVTLVMVLAAIAAMAYYFLSGSSLGNNVPPPAPR